MKNENKNEVIQSGAEHFCKLNQHSVQIHFTSRNHHFNSEWINFPNETTTERREINKNPERIEKCAKNSKEFFESDQ